MLAVSAVDWTVEACYIRTMLKATAVRHFGSQRAVARLLRLTPAAISLWGPVVPLLSAQRLALATSGALAVDPSLYDHRGRPLKPQPAIEPATSDAA